MVAPIRRGNESICSLVLGRQHGLYYRSPSQFFERGLSRFFRQKQYLPDLEIVSPHRQSVLCMSLDKGSGRFLLAGSADATISVYDTSKWGASEDYVMRQHNNNHHNHTIGHKAFPPVARSIKAPFLDNDDDDRILETPNGHSCSLSHVQWYPADTGAFLSSSSDGCILLWDTNQMQPVLRAQPFDHSSTWCSTHLQTGGDYSLIAAGSWNHAELKLVDVKSGAHSHQLTGHEGGITQVQWSPTNTFVLASGSRDGTVRLWDIRKSGSRACITILDQEASRPVQVKSYAGDYSHLRAEFLKKTKMFFSSHNKRRRIMAAAAGPNNYNQVQNAVGRSHNGRVAALEFFPDGQALASVGAPNGDLHIWDLRLGVMVPTKFVAPGGLSACTPRKRMAAMCIESDGSMIWVGHGSNLLGFAVGGGGASPTQVLGGHLHNVCCIDRMDPVRNLVSGSQDGMILCWGSPQLTTESTRRKKSKPTEDRDKW